MTNLDLLAYFLREEGIPHEFNFQELGDNLYKQICIPSVEKFREFGGDIISHPYSYGGTMGLLEIMGFGGHDVTGYLDAEEAFVIIKKWWGDGSNV